MRFYVYLLISKIKGKHISYVGYTGNVNKRILLHNKSKGAKFTRGNKWILVYKKSYKNKSLAMKEEYKLKKNYNYRKLLKNKYLRNE
jgi:Predicted endonuclease containing a URI domain